MDRSTSPKNNYVSINTNDQETQDPFLSNPDNGFSPRTHIRVPSELLTELLTIHKKSSYKQIKYVVGFLFIVGIIGLILIGMPYALPKCNSSDSKCEINRMLLRLIGLIITGVAVFTISVVYCILRCMLSCSLDSFKQRTGNDQPILWKLTGEEWSCFVDYIYGPEREWHQEPCAPSFCCRRQSYERLRNRQYGHIILHKNGFIIDELYLVAFETNSLIRIEIANFGNDSLKRLLRMHVVLTRGKHFSTIYFDLLAPSSVTLEQLQAIVQAYRTVTP